MSLSKEQETDLQELADELLQSRKQVALATAYRFLRDEAQSGRTNDYALETFMDWCKEGIVL